MKTKHKSSLQEKFTLFDVMIYVIYTLFAFVCIYPFYYIFINTISDNSLVARGHVMFYPIGIHFENYIQIFTLDELFNATLISIARTLLGTALSLISASFMGYAFSRREYLGRKFWYRFTIATMYFNAGIIPWFLNMRMLGLTNNFLGYILPALAAPYYLILVKTYIESIPATLEESAEIDGAGYLVRYMKIILPLSKPILATIAIFAAVGQWNSFMDTVYLMTDDSLFTLQFLLFRYLNQATTLTQMMQSSGGDVVVNTATDLTPTAIRFTITIVATVPVLIVYPFFQRHFVKGIMLGAVKG